MLEGLYIYIYVGHIYTIYSIYTMLLLMYDFDFILVLLCPLDTGGHVACLLPSVSSSDTEWRGPITNGVLLLLQCYSKLDLLLIILCQHHIFLLMNCMVVESMSTHLKYGNKKIPHLKIVKAAFVVQPKCYDSEYFD